MNLKLQWWIIILAHGALYLSNIIAFIFVMIYQPWYIFVLMGTFFFSPAMVGIFCVFTNLENQIRGQLEWPLIPDDSISHFLRWLRAGKGTIVKVEELTYRNPIKELNYVYRILDEVDNRLKKVEDK